MMNENEWKDQVVERGLTFCPTCESTEPTMGACGVGSILV